MATRRPLIVISLKTNRFLPMHIGNVLLKAAEDIPTQIKVSLPPPPPPHQKRKKKKKLYIDNNINNNNNSNNNNYDNNNDNKNNNNPMWPRCGYFGIDIAILIYFKCLRIVAHGLTCYVIPCRLQVLVGYISNTKQRHIRITDLRNIPIRHVLDFLK